MRFFDVGSFSILSLLPVVLICVIFYYISQKKKSDLNKKTKKDDLWLIIKEYLKDTDRKGYEICDLTLYPRPESLRLKDYIHETYKLLAKQEAKKNKIKYVVPKKPYKYEEEYYFEKLEHQTRKKVEKDYLLQDTFLSKSTNINKTSKILELKRKRYLVCFKTKTKTKNKIISPWEAIEIELFKNVDNAKNKQPYKIIFNKKLDYLKELIWIYPMQQDYLNEKVKKEAEKQKSINKLNKKSKFNIKNLFLWKRKS